MKDRTGEALLVDPGSPENLVGEQWSQHQRSECKKAGRPEPRHELKLQPIVSPMPSALGMVTKQHIQHQRSQAVERLHCWDSAR
eukprot:1877393-Karenia_brevis.AAC.1